MTLSFKVILLPYILYVLVRKLKIRKESEALVNIPRTMMIGIALVIFSYHLHCTGDTAFNHGNQVDIGRSLGNRHARPADDGYQRTRRDPDNRLSCHGKRPFFAATSATYGMPMVVELGVALDLLIAAFIFGIFFFHINTTFDSLDVEQMAKLKEEG